MHFDIPARLGLVDRTVTAGVREGIETRSIRISRVYDTRVEDLWDAFTSAERLPRWFLPVEGELREGGRYQLVGNASGTILACRPPERLSLSWEFGDEVSWVEVGIAPGEGGGARLTLEHIAPLNDFWTQYGPGAGGVGWDLGLLGLAMHLDDPNERFDEAAFGQSSDGRAFVRGSAAAWGQADIAFGTEPAAAHAAADRTAAFYTGDAEAGH